MVVVGIILLILGLVFAIPLLFWIGIALILIGLFFNFYGPVGASGTRRRYY